MAKGSAHIAKMNCIKVAMRSYPGNNCLTLCCNKEEFSYFCLPSNDEAQLTSWFIVMVRCRAHPEDDLFHPGVQVKSRFVLCSCLSLST